MKLTCTMAIGLLATAAHADTIIVYVNGALATGANNGSSWANAFRGGTALQSALTAATVNVASGSTVQVWVARGTYVPSQRTIPAQAGTETFLLSSRLALYGGFVGNELSLLTQDPAANPTILSGILPAGHALHVVTASGVDSTGVLDGFTITGGALPDSGPGHDSHGGGLLLLASSPVIGYCTITGNGTSGINLGGSAGGGAYSDGAGAPFFHDCAFSGNKAQAGSAIYGPMLATRCSFTNNGSLPSPLGVGGAVDGSGTLDQCLFQSNAAGEGSAILGSFTVRSSTFHQNSGDGAVVNLTDGSVRDCVFDRNFTSGQLLTGAGTVAIQGCRFTGNSSGSGVALVPSRTLTNCLFTDNQCDLAVSGTPVALTNCTFLRTGSQAGVRVGNGSVIANCVMWGNSAPDQAHQIQVTSGSITLSHSCVQGLTGSLGGVGNFGADPRLDAQGRFLPASPCIDAGDSAAVPAGVLSDAYGQPRFRDDPGSPNNGPGAAPVDIGAFEFQGATCYPNCDGSTNAPAINAGDFTCFLQKFAAGDPYANCDSSTNAPILNTGDFTCFLQKFAAGCA